MKELLSDYAVPYTLKYVIDDPGALNEFQRTGFLLPPVTVINGVAVAGYDPTRLIALLDAALANDMIS